jgi:hypothetical protein
VEAFENFFGDWFERIKWDQLLALQQPFISFDARFDLNPLVRQGPGGFGKETLSL